MGKVIISAIAPNDYGNGNGTGSLVEAVKVIMDGCTHRE